MPAPSDLLVGAVISGSYQIDALLGQGGMGKVYAAQHLRLPRRAAVKVLQPELARDPDLLKRFQREAEIASSLGSRHIVQVFDFGLLANGAPYMLMEFLEGQDLDKHLCEQGRLHPREVVELFDQAVAGLTVAHANNVIHRDIKPANLFLAREADGSTLLKILDFGLSKVRGASLSLSGANAVGTPAYMSPEQLRAADTLDQRTDVYALGVTMFELLTGARPFDDPSVTRLCEHILSDPPPSARARRESLTPEIDAVILRALAKDPAERYASAAEFWSAARPALLLCAAEMPTVELVGGTPIPGADPNAQARMGMAQTFISGPRVPAESKPDETANLRGPPPDQARTQADPQPQSAPSLPPPVAQSRRPEPWVILVALASLVVIAAAGWVLSRPAPTSPTVPPPVAAAPVAAAPVAVPKPTTPAPAPVAPAPPPAIAEPAPPSTSQPAPKQKRPSRRAHRSASHPDELLGADTLDH